MPTGIRNVVCDECHGGRMAYLPSGEIQLEHGAYCPHKWREDTFLIDLVEGMLESNPGNKAIAMSTYPDAKLNPIIYDMLCDGCFTEHGNKTFAKSGQSKAQIRAQKVNKNFQLVREEMIKDGTWYYLHKELTECTAV